MMMLSDLTNFPLLHRPMNLSVGLQNPPEVIFSGVCAIVEISY